MLNAKDCSVDALEARDTTVVPIAFDRGTLVIRQVTPEVIVAEVVVRPEVDLLGQVAPLQFLDHPWHPFRGQVGLSAREVDHRWRLRIREVEVEEFCRRQQVPSGACSR